MREKSQVTRAAWAEDRGGFESAITVMDLRISEAVFGITRTILHRSFATGSVSPESEGPYICVSIDSTDVPARILSNSFPCSALSMPGSRRMPSLRFLGLHPRRITSASWTPFKFWLRSMVREDIWSERAVLTLLADASRVTQAMKREGTWGGRLLSSCPAAGVAILEADEDELEAFVEERESSIPERIAIPKVPEHMSLLTRLSGYKTYRIPTLSKS
ncbi:MAG: hypothetical protein Q9194_002132 [Teloschistes cf. exilis]